MLPNRYKWRKNKENKCENLIEKILNNRGIDGIEEIESFLHPTKEMLHSPYLLNDMEKAVERIVRVKNQNKHVVIYGDYDVDGITSTSVLYMFLKRANYCVSYYIPDRQTEGYGLNKQAIESISQYADLIITVDTGIAAVEELRFANTLGIDVIITDHHECQVDLPDAYCIINPKRKDSTYPFEALAGVGVTFKLIHALALYEKEEEMIWEYMDLVALGTIADVVPLIHENRTIAYLGFEAMKNTSNLGLRELIKVISNGETHQKVTSNMIAYQIGPRINAAGRLSDAKIGVELLTTQDKIKAAELAKVLDEENKKRQDMESYILEQAEKYIKDNVDVKSEKVIIVAGKEWHHGVIGIVASKIMSKYYRPTIVLTEEEGVFSGSARSIEGFNIFEAIQHAKDFLLRFGGHEMAAGLSLQAECFNDFKQLINSCAEQLIDEDMLVPSMDIDLELGIRDVGIDFCEALEQLEPFGAHNPVPLFSIRGKVQFVQTMGQQDRHLRLTIEEGQQVLQGVGFYKGYLADYLSVGEEVIIGGEIVKNVWNGRVSVQLHIKDVQSSEKELLRSRYYTSLYHALKNPFQIDSRKMKLKKADYALEDAKMINVYTEEGFYKVYEMIKNTSKNVNFSQKVCYNKACLKKDDQVICVNPLQSDHSGINYEWDFQTAGEVFMVSDETVNRHKNQLVRMIPSHKDCSEVYKLLKANALEYMTIHKAIVNLSAYQMTEYKLFQIFEIFNELGILKHRIEEDIVYYELIPTGKTRLESSAIYRNMQRFSESILQIN